MTLVKFIHTFKTNLTKQNNPTQRSSLERLYPLPIRNFWTIHGTCTRLFVYPKWSKIELFYDGNFNPC